MNEWESSYHWARNQSCSCERKYIARTAGCRESTSGENRENTELYRRTGKTGKTHTLMHRGKTHNCNGEQGDQGKLGEFYIGVMNERKVNKENLSLPQCAFDGIHKYKRIGEV